MLPHQLEDGIFLEDTGTLLPWNTQLDHLKKIGSPEVRIESDRAVLHWRKRRWLDGLECTISAKFYHDSETRSNTQTTAQGLRLVNYHVHSPSEENARESYVRIKDALVQRLGKPTADYEDYEHGLPLAEWDFEQVLVVLMIFERFGEYLVGEVWRKPLPKWRVQS